MKNLFVILLFFSAISCQKDLSDKQKEAYKELGNNITKEVAAELMSNLTQKISSGGIELAVPFCYENALKITDEFSEIYHADIKRASHNFRNPQNKPTKNEQEIIEKYQKDLANKAVLEPIVKIKKSSKIEYFSPIILQSKCLACHGTLGNEVSKQTDSLIKSYYPGDLATGFKEGDLRGIWKITFNEIKHENIN